MRVVSNASPLINLGAIGQLDLLRQLYRRMTVAPAVWNEVVRLGEGKPGSRAVRTASWIRVKAVRVQLKNDLGNERSQRMIERIAAVPSESELIPRQWQCPC